MQFRVNIRVLLCFDCFVCFSTQIIHRGKTQRFIQSQAYNLGIIHCTQNKIKHELQEAFSLALPHCIVLVGYEYAYASNKLAVTNYVFRIVIYSTVVQSKIQCNFGIFVCYCGMTVSYVPQHKSYTQAKTKVTFNLKRTIWESSTVHKTKSNTNYNWLSV